MEIFSEEFKIELSKQLETITFESKKEKTNKMMDFEALQESIGHCFIYDINNERKEKNNIFKLDDVVFIGDLEGKVIKCWDGLELMHVYFENGITKSFLTDGRIFQESPKVLSHYPYELKKKKSKH